MRETPEILALSNMLERPAGRYTSYGVTCVGPVAAITLAAARYSEEAIKVASVAFLGLIVVINLTILKCGRCLVRTINSSLQNATERSRRSSTSASASVGRKDLLAAKRKIKIAVNFCLVLAVQTIVLLMIAVCTTYGTSAPLLMFGVPHGYAPFVWFAFNVQLHAGRSNRRRAQGSAAVTNGPEQGASGFISRVASMVKSATSSQYYPMRAAKSHSSQQPIIPVEAITHSQYSIVPVEDFTLTN